MNISMLDILAFVVILGVMVIAHELGHYIMAKRAGVKVEEFGFGYPPRLFGIRRGETLYSVNLVPLGGFVKMLGEEDPAHERSFASARKSWRAIVLVAGPAMNLFLAVLLFAASFMAGWPTPLESEVVVSGVQPGSPAEAGGLRTGDQLVSMSGLTVTGMQDVKSAVSTSAGSAIQLVVRRDGAEVALSVRPGVGTAGNLAIGVSLSQRATKIARKSYPPAEAIVKGARQTAEMVALTFYVPVLALRGQIPAEAARPVGPVGIFDVVSQAASETVSRNWWFPLLSTTALLSVGLGVANLLPIPGLDGGRLLFVLLEAVRRKRVSPERETMIHLVGIAFLLSMVVVISYFDLLAPIGTIDWGPQ